MPAGWVSAGVAAVGLINNMTSGGGGGGSSSSGSGAQGQYDPYSPYRAGAASTLQTLLQDPSSALSQPGYQQQLKQGMETTKRGMAASGQLQSGAEQAALQSLGQNTFAQYYNSMLANYAQYSGATQNPASAALAQQQGANLAQNRLFGNVNQLASGVGAIANSGLFSGSSNTNANNYSYFGGSGGGWTPQADTSSTASTASNFYGSTYDPNAGWSA
jgi:hypothetical protein